MHVRRSCKLRYPNLSLLPKPPEPLEENSLRKSLRSSAVSVLP